VAAAKEKYLREFGTDTTPGIRGSRIEYTIKEVYMTSEKAQKILDAIKKQDRQTLKHWTPYKGPADWDFIVLNAPKTELEEPSNG
jgi:hypothetical protein